MMILKPTDALLIVDAQPSFMSRGGLTVTSGVEIIPVIAALQQRPFGHQYATRNVHPPGHISLASSYQLTCLDREGLRIVDSFTELTLGNMYSFRPGPRAQFTIHDVRSYLARVGGKQLLWSDYCLRGSRESEIHPDLDTSRVLVYEKGGDPKCDSYSALADNMGRATGLAVHLQFMRDQGHITRVFVCGLDFDYCVGWTALGLRKLGFDVVVIMNATRAITTEGADTMSRELESRGIKLKTSV